MFIENKYKKCYDRIIKAAMNRDIEGYTEKHHILPKSLGGTNDATNLVALTAREHYVCHWLLTKFIEETYYRKKMKNALGRFVQQSKLQKRNLTSRQFERARKAVSEANTGRYYSVETRARMSELAKGRTPWNKGLTGAQQYTEENKEVFDEFISKDEEILAISSPYGTGKTYTFKKLIPNFKKILFITYRQSLAKSLHDELSEEGFKNYSELNEFCVLRIKNLNNKRK
jgi:hypothetical protein